MIAISTPKWNIWKDPASVESGMWIKVVCSGVLLECNEVLEAVKLPFWITPGGMLPRPSQYPAIRRLDSNPRGSGLTEPTLYSAGGVLSTNELAAWNSANENTRRPRVPRMPLEGSWVACYQFARGSRRLATHQLGPVPREQSFGAHGDVLRC